MKKVSIFLVIVFIFTFFLNSCSFNYEDNSENSKIKNGDWAYKLPNEYEIWHINSRSIVCGKKKTTNSINTLIGGFISAFCYNKNIVVLQQVDVPTDISEPIDTSKPVYYIIDTINDKLYGPFTADEYEDKINEFKTNGLTDWIYTVPTPEGVVYE